MILVQLSDLHVRPPGVPHRVVGTSMLAERAMRSVRVMRPRPDAVVVSGDVADCGLAAEYEEVAALLRRHLDDVPVYLVPGNHDRREMFRAGLAACPGVTQHPDFVQYVVDDLPVRLVMLDSVVPGAGHGELCPARLAWLDAALARAPERQTMLVLHHPPIRCGLPGMDAINLRQSEALAEVVARHPQVERILCGHHHRSMLGRLRQAVVSVAPSVAHQSEFDLLAGRDRLVLEPPAYQVHVGLPDGGIVSHTVFVESFPGPFPYLIDPDYPGRTDPGAGRNFAPRPVVSLVRDTGEQDMAKADATQMEKLWSMIKDIQFAMLTSEDGDVLRSRPMAASQSSFEGELWFFTRADSHKVAEVNSDHRVGVSYADPQHQNYVSLSGTASLVRDQAAIESHWNEALRTWFPKGKADPDIALLKVDVQQAEYWDAPNSKMVHAYGYVKAVLTGAAPHPGDNAKLDLA